MKSCPFCNSPLSIYEYVADLWKVYCPSCDWTSRIFRTQQDAEAWADQRASSPEYKRLRVACWDAIRTQTFANLREALITPEVAQIIDPAQGTGTYFTPALVLGQPMYGESGKPLPVQCTCKTCKSELRFKIVDVDPDNGYDQWVSEVTNRGWEVVDMQNIYCPNHVLTGRVDLEAL